MASSCLRGLFIDLVGDILYRHNISDFSCSKLTPLVSVELIKFYAPANMNNNKKATLRSGIIFGQNNKMSFRYDRPFI